MYAAMYNQITPAKCLIRYGANLSDVDDLHRDAMEYARIAKHSDFITLLTDQHKATPRNQTATSLSSVL